MSLHHLNRDSGSRANAAGKFAEAMRHDISSSESFFKASGNVIAFANAVSRNGLNQALHDFGRDDLIGKSLLKVFLSLMDFFSSESFLHTERRN